MKSVVISVLIFLSLNVNPPNLEKHKVFSVSAVIDMNSIRKLRIEIERMRRPAKFYNKRHLT